MIDELVEPVLQCKLEPVAVNTELPQLLTTVIIGGTGIALGDAVTLPGALIQPPTVCVTE